METIKTIALEEGNHSKIVVVVEAIDPQLSGTFQANQSYKYEDIVFGADHETCTSITPDNKIQVDMKTFHEIQYTDEGRHMLLSSSLSSSDEGIPEMKSISHRRTSTVSFGSHVDQQFCHYNNKCAIKAEEHTTIEGHIPVCIEAVVEEEKKIEEKFHIGNS